MSLGLFIYGRSLDKTGVLCYSALSWYIIHLSLIESLLTVRV